MLLHEKQQEPKSKTNTLKIEVNIQSLKHHKMACNSEKGLIDHFTHIILIINESGSIRECH